MRQRNQIAMVSIVVTHRAAVKREEEREHRTERVPRVAARRAAPGSRDSTGETLSSDEGLDPPKFAHRCKSAAGIDSDPKGLLKCSQRPTMCC